MPSDASSLERSRARVDSHGRGSRLATAVTDAETHLWVVAVVTSLSDVALTVVGLRLGLSEVNPVVAAFVARFGFVALVALKTGALAIGLTGWAVVSRPYRGLVPLGLALLWTTATASNALTIALHLLSSG